MSPPRPPPAQPSRQAELYAYICTTLLRTGQSPSWREMARALGVSLTRIGQLVARLRAEGLIEVAPGSQRSIRVPRLANRIAQAVLEAEGWTVNPGALSVAPPCALEQLPLIAALEHLPDIAD